MTAETIRQSIDRFCTENQTEILWQTKNLSPLIASGRMPHDAFIDMLASLFCATTAQEKENATVPVQALPSQPV